MPGHLSRSSLQMRSRFCGPVPGIGLGAVRILGWSSPAKSLRRRPPPTGPNKRGPSWRREWIPTARRRLGRSSGTAAADCEGIASTGGTGTDKRCRQRRQKHARPAMRPDGSQPSGGAVFAGSSLRNPAVWLIVSSTPFRSPQEHTPPYPGAPPCPAACRQGRDQASLCCWSS